MDIDVLEECRRLLLHKVQRYDQYNAERIIDFIAAHIPLEEIRWYSSSTSDEQIRPLFDQASAALQLLPPQQPPSRGQGLGLQFPQSQPQLHPVNNSQRFQHPLPLPHSQLQFVPSGSYGNLAPFLGSSGSFGGNQALFCLPYWEPQFYPSSSFCGHQVLFRPTGPIGVFQNPFPGFAGSGAHLQPQTIPGDGMQSNNRNAHQSATGYPPSSSNAQNEPCKYHFNWGRCKKGGDCPFSHASSCYPRMKKKWPIHSLETLPELDSKINSLLSMQKSPLRIEHLPQAFFEEYGLSLLVKGFQPEGQEQGKESYSLRSLLMQLKTIKVIERDGQHYVVSVADACAVGKAADDSKSVADASCGSSKIFIVFYPYRRFTAKDVENYFSKYGPVNYAQIPNEKTFGSVSFVYPETVKLILSEDSQRTHHYIRGQRVKVYPYKEKHEQQKLAQRDAHSNSREHMASDVNVTREHQRNHNTAESSNASNRLNNTSEDEDIDEYGLPHSLGI